LFVRRTKPHSKRNLGVELETTGWLRAAEIGKHLSWTRDPFDRLIVAHALAYSAVLCTRDRLVRDNYSHATWLEIEPSLLSNEDARYASAQPGVSGWAPISRE